MMIEGVSKQEAMNDEGECCAIRASLTAVCHLHSICMCEALKLGASSICSSSGVFLKSCSLMRTRVIDSGLPLLHVCARARNLQRNAAYIMHVCL